MKKSQKHTKHDFTNKTTQMELKN